MSRFLVYVCLSLCIVGGGCSSQRQEPEPKVVDTESGEEDILQEDKYVSGLPDDVDQLFLLINGIEYELRELSEFELVSEKGLGVLSRYRDLAKGVVVDEGHEEYRELTIRYFDVQIEGIQKFNKSGNVDSESITISQIAQTKIFIQFMKKVKDEFGMVQVVKDSADAIEQMKKISGYVE